MKLISIIVPVYNVERYIVDCLESLIKQSYRNIEIILVDDGSTDNSGRICDEYKKKDNRIKVVHQVNGGLGNARNTGLDNASGDYIMFCDPDDMFINNTCEIMLNEIINKSADFITANYQNCYDDGVLWTNPIFDIDKFNNFKLNIKDYDKTFYVMNSSVCNKIYSKKFLDSIDARFKEKVPAEDAIFNTYCFIKATDVYYINDIIYLYRQRDTDDSISTNLNAEYFKGINNAYKMIYDNFNDNNELGFYRYFYAKSMTYILYKFIDSRLLNESEKIEVLEKMKWFYKLSEKLNVPACQDSLKYVINKITMGNYKDAIDICEVIYDIRKNLSKKNREAMSKPQPELYQKLKISGAEYDK